MPVDRASNPAQQAISTYDQEYELLYTGVCITTPKHQFAPSVGYNVNPYIFSLWSQFQSCHWVTEGSSTLQFQTDDEGVYLKQSWPICVTGHICHYLYFIVFSIVLPMPPAFALSSALHSPRWLTEVFKKLLASLWWQVAEMTVLI